MKTQLLGVLTLAACLAVTSSVQGETLPGTKIYDQVLRGTVCVRTPLEGGKEVWGTGWVVDVERRLVVTNFHVISRSDTPHVSFPLFKDGRVIADRGNYPVAKAVQGQLLDSDPRTDLAIVQLPSLPPGTQALKIAKSKPRPAERLHLVGNPGASDGFWVYTTGHVRQLVHKVATYRSHNQTINCGVLELQMPTNSGDSGSALVNDAGEVVGINSGANHDPGVQSIVWAIDTDELRPILEDVTRVVDGIEVGGGVYERRGERLMRRERYKDAITELTRALEQDSARARSWLARGIAHLRTNDFDRAYADCTRAIPLMPHSSVPLFYRAEASMARKQYAQAVADYTRSIELAPLDSEDRYRRGVAYKMLKQEEKALADFAEAIRLNPACVEAYFHRAGLHREAKKYTEAEADLVAALRLRPKNAFLLGELGQVFQADQKYTLALEKYNEALEAGHSEKPRVFTWMGETYHSQVRHELALTAFSGAILLDPKAASAWYGRGAVYEDLGDAGRADADYTRAVELDPALAKQFKTFASRRVEVTNPGTEAVTVRYRYEARTKTGAWKWFPAEGWLTQEVAPGKTAILVDKGWRVHARKIRVQTEEEMESTNRGREVVIVEKPYRTRKMMPWVLDVGPAKTRETASANRSPLRRSMAGAYDGR